MQRHLLPHVFFLPPALSASATLNGISFSKFPGKLFLQPPGASSCPHFLRSHPSLPSSAKILPNFKSLLTCPSIYQRSLSWPIYSIVRGHWVAFLHLPKFPLYPSSQDSLHKCGGLFASLLDCEQHQSKDGRYTVFSHILMVSHSAWSWLDAP